MCVPKNQGGMGFRDIHCFNLAMLAKQCWRLIENNASLCAKVLRARYYPNGDILNHELKRVIVCMAEYMDRDPNLQEGMHLESRRWCKNIYFE